MAICFVMLPWLLSVAESPLAFPGAEGFGKYAEGGRYGSVYHVTNLNDSGPGSLREAVSSPNRIVVFDVSGVIKLQSRLVFSHHLYVAGQSAPGEGITIYGNGVSFSGADHSIIRYLRIRMGSGGDSGKDAAGVAHGQNMIFDHLSVSWGLDETFSINSDGGALGDITIQNCIMSQGLMTHSAGGLIQADHITMYRNLYVDNSTRNNKIKGTNQYVNNIVYNWKNGCYLMGGDSQGMSYCNAVSNLFINGPAVGGAAFTGGNSNFHIYAEDNWQDKDRNGLFAPYLIPRNEYSGPPTFMETPYDYPLLPVYPGKDLIDSLIPSVGDSWPYRDPVDFYVIDELMSFGKEGALISKEAELPIGLPTDWPQFRFTKEADTDGDGMPDAWERACGTDPSKNDAMNLAPNGYANIENYLNSIPAKQVQTYLRLPFTFTMEESTQHSLTLSWRDYTEGEDGFAVEQKIGDSYVEIVRIPASDYRLMTTSGDARGAAAGPKTGMVHCTIRDLGPATSYTFRVRAYVVRYDGQELYSDYSQECACKTQPEYVAMIEWDSYVPDLIWNAGSASWNRTDANWSGQVYSDQTQVLIASDSNQVIHVQEKVQPSAVVVGGKGNLSLTGEAINGTASVNKFGEGRLQMGSAEHTYTGATALHEGVLRFSSLKNGGVPSGIGASQEFAQNWIWNGGTWQYTGPSTSTNRSAKLYRNTTFDIANNAVVTMSGTLEGTGGLILKGGQLSVASNAFFGYTGETRLEPGSTLYLSTTEISKKGIGSSSKLVMAGGTLKTKGESSNYETYSFPMEIVEGTLSTIEPNRNCSIACRVYGSGDLCFRIPYVREYVTGNWDDFYGRLYAYGTGSDKDGSQLMLNNSGFRHAVVELQKNTRVVSWKAGATCYLGGLAGEATSFLSCASKNTDNTTMTWIVGGANTDETFRGVIDNCCSSTGHHGKTNIQKIGSGDWRLTGANVHSGTTSVQGGRLIVNGSFKGTGAVNVAADATLCGTGSIAGKVTVAQNGVLAVGDTLFNRNDVLTLSGGCNLQAGAIVELPLYRKQTLNYASKIKFGANSTLNGILRLNMTEVSIDIPDNSSFTLFTIPSGVTLSGSITAVEPARPSATQVWDLSELLTSGKIYIRPAEPDALRQSAIEPVSVQYFDLCGRRLPAMPSHDTPQLVLARKFFADGSIKTEKIRIQ